MDRRAALLLATSFLLLVVPSPLPAETPPDSHGHDATVTHRFDDVDRWVKVFDDPSRDRWQKPKKVVRFLRIAAGARVADLGAGTGYFTVHLARAVGRSGKVYAVDIEPNLVEHLRGRAREAGLPQVVPVLAEPTDPKLPEGGVGLILICDTWHHIDDRLSYLRVLERVLEPGGRVAVVDFHEGELPVGPPAGHKLSREAVIEEFRAAGWVLTGELDELEYQYVLVFAPPRG